MTITHGSPRLAHPPPSFSLASFPTFPLSMTAKEARSTAEQSRAEKENKESRKEGCRPRKRRGERERGNCPSQREEKTDRFRRLRISHLVTSLSRSLQLCIHLYLAISKGQRTSYAMSIVCSCWVSSAKAPFHADYLLNYALT